MVSEPWVGFVAAAQCSLYDCPAILLAVPGKYNGYSIGRMGDGAALLQAWQDVTIPSGQSRSTTAYFAVGTLAQARSSVYNLHGLPGQVLWPGQGLGPNQTLYSP